MAVKCRFSHNRGVAVQKFHFFWPILTGSQVRLDFPVGKVKKKGIPLQEISGSLQDPQRNPPLNPPLGEER